MTMLRTKEIGVRKVLGSSTFQLVYLLSANYLKLVLIAFVIAYERMARAICLSHFV
jgi:hypothetical protein